MKKYRVTSIPQSLKKAQDGEEITGLDPNQSVFNNVNYLDNDFNIQQPTQYTLNDFVPVDSRTPQQEANTFANIVNWPYGETIPEHDFTYTTAKDPLSYYSTNQLPNGFGLGYKNGFSPQTQYDLGMSMAPEMVEKTMTIPEQFIPNYYAPYTQTGEELKCPQGQIAYKGQCVSEEAYNIIRDQEFEYEQYQKDQERQKFYDDIWQLKLKNDRDRYNRYQKTFDESGKYDRIEAHISTPKSGWLNETITDTDEFGNKVFNEDGSEKKISMQDYWSRSHFINKNKDGSVGLYPISMIEDRIWNNGFNEYSFEKYWGLDRKKVKEQFGAFMKKAKDSYNFEVSGQIFKDAINKNMTIAEAIDALPERVGYKDALRKRFQGKLENFVSELYDELVTENAKQISGKEAKSAEKSFMDKYGQEGLDYKISSGQIMVPFGQEDMSGYKGKGADNFMYTGLDGQRINLNNVNDNSFNWDTDIYDTQNLMDIEGNSSTQRVFDPVNNYADWWVKQGKTKEERQKRRNQVTAINNKKYDDFAESSPINTKFESDLFTSPYKYNQTYADDGTLARSTTGYRNAVAGMVESQKAAARQNFVNESRIKELKKLIGFDEAWDDHVKKSSQGYIDRVMQNALENPNLTVEDKRQYLSNRQAFQNNPEAFPMTNLLGPILDKDINWQSWSDAYGGFTGDMSQFSKANQYNTGNMGNENLYSNYSSYLNNKSYADIINNMYNLPAIEQAKADFANYWDNAPKFTDASYKPPKRDLSGFEKGLDYLANLPTTIMYGMDYRKNPDDMTPGIYDSRTGKEMTYTQLKDLEKRTGERIFDEGAIGNFITDFINPFNPVYWGANLRNAYDIDGIEGFGEKFVDLGIDLGTSRIPFAKTLKYVPGSMPVKGLFGKLNKLNPLHWMSSAGSGNMLARGITNLGNLGKGTAINYFNNIAPFYALNAIRPGGLFQSGVENIGEGNYWTGAGEILGGGLSIMPYVGPGGRSLLNYTTPGGKSFGIGTRVPQFTTVNDRNQFIALYKGNTLNNLRKLHTDPADFQALEQRLMQGTARPTFEFTHPSSVTRRLQGLPRNEQSVMENIGFRQGLDNTLEMGTFNNPFRFKGRFGELSGPQRFYPMKTTGYEGIQYDPSYTPPNMLGFKRGGSIDLPEAQLGIEAAKKAGNLIWNGLQYVVNPLTTGLQNTTNLANSAYSLGTQGIENAFANTDFMQNKYNVTNRFLEDVGNTEDWLDRMQYAQDLVNYRYVNEDAANMDWYLTATRNEEAMNKLMEAAIRQDRTSWRQTTPRIPMVTDKYSSNRTLSMDEYQDLRNKIKSQGVDLNNEADMSGYMSTHIPYYRFGYREGLGNLWKGDAIYGHGRPEKAGQDYGYHQWRITAGDTPLDFSEGNYKNWFDTYIANKQPIWVRDEPDEYGGYLKKLNPGIKYGLNTFFEPGYTAGRSTITGEGLDQFVPGSGIGTSRLAGLEGQQVATLDIDPNNPFDAYTNLLTSEGQQKMLAEQEAIQKAWDSGFTNIIDPEVNPKGTDYERTNFVKDALDNIDSNPDVFEATPEFIKNMEKANTTFDQLLADSQLDKLNRWESPEGRRRLQNMIDNTPTLLFSGVTPEDYINAIGGLESPNRKFLGELNDALNDLKIADQYEKMIITLEDTGMGMENWEHYNTQMQYHYDKAMSTIEQSEHLKEMNTMGKQNAFHTNITDKNDPTTAGFSLSKLVKEHEIGAGTGTITSENINALKQTIEHEFGHLLQKGYKTNLDLTLGNLELKGDDLFSEAVRERTLGTQKDMPKTERSKDPTRFARSKEYFQTGSKGKEKLPFALEVRERMLQNGIIDDIYDDISSAKIKQYYNQYMKSEKDFELRLFDVMQNTDANFDILSWVLNRAPSIMLGIGAGTQLMDDDSKQQSPEKFKLGGTIKKEDIGIIMDLDANEIAQYAKNGWIIEDV
jgi:hypothetical protein